MHHNNLPAYGSACRCPDFDYSKDIPIRHTGYRESMHTQDYSATTDEMARDLPPSQVLIYHFPRHLEYTHCYDHCEEIYDEDRANPRHANFRPEMHSKQHTAQVEETIRDLPPALIKIQHMPQFLEYTHLYGTAETEVTEKDREEAQHVNFRPEMHQKTYSTTLEEAVHDLPPTQVKVHHHPQFLEYSHQYERAGEISETDRTGARQANYRSDLHGKEYSSVKEELIRDLPPTQVKVHHVPSRLVYDHQYDRAGEISAKDREQGKHANYRPDLHNVQYSATKDELARDLPPRQVKVQHMPQNLEISHNYERGAEITAVDREQAQHTNYRADMHQVAYTARSEAIARDLPSKRIRVHHTPQNLEFNHKYDEAGRITEHDRAQGKHANYRTELHNKPYSASTVEIARDLPPVQVRVNHMPQRLEVSHRYDQAGVIQEQDRAAPLTGNYRPEARHLPQCPENVADRSREFHKPFMASGQGPGNISYLR